MGNRLRGYMSGGRAEMYPLSYSAGGFDFWCMLLLFKSVDSRLFAFQDFIDTYQLDAEDKDLACQL